MAKASDMSNLRHTFIVTSVMIAACGLLLLSGCGGSDPATSLSLNKGKQNQTGWRDSFFEFAIDNLNRLEQYDDQMQDRVIGRLNEWMPLVEPIPWKEDPLVEKLPEKYRQLPEVAGLADERFTVYDGDFLRGVTWFRDAANSASIDPALRATLPQQGQGDPQQDAESRNLAQAMRLFDWTVRNIALESEDDASEGRPLYLLPWQTMLRGRGSAIERAWVFQLLARQRGLNVVMLAYRDSDDDSVWHDWAPALFVEGSEDDPVSSSKLFVFEPSLGLPIPGPANQPVATLADLRANDELLRQLDLDEDHAYPVSSEQLEHVAAWIEGSPGYLARRESQLEFNLMGSQKMILHVDASALAGKLQATEKLDEAGLWDVPYEALRLQRDDAARQTVATHLPGRGGQETPSRFRPWLTSVRTGRELHLKGKYTEDEGALKKYQESRPSNTEIENSLTNRKSSASSANDSSEDTGEQDERSWLTEDEAELARRAKHDASYWLGVVAFERGDFDTAIDYFQRRTLEAWPDGPWTDAAKYNLARTYEAQERFDEAIELYEQDNSPQSAGNKLRAHSLKGEPEPPPVQGPEQAE